MGFEVAIASADARVRSHPIARDVARNVPGTAMYVVVTPIAPPRLWSWLAGAALDGFEKTMAGSEPTPASMGQGIASAANAVDRLRGQLIEPHLMLDVRFGSLLTARDSIHVALTAGVRVYRARGGVPERLFNKAQRPEGIAAGPPFVASESVTPGDLLFFGTREAFSVRSIGNLAGTLSKSTGAAVTDLCEALIAPARDGGEGAAVVVLRAI